MTLRMYEPDRYLNAWLSAVGANIPSPGEIHMVYNSGTGTPYGYFRRIIDDSKMHSTIANAHTAMTTGRHDVALLTQEAHSSAAAITWSKSYTHLIGMAKPGSFFSGYYPEISISADAVPLLHVTGAGNLFANLSFKFGRGYSGSNMYCLRLGTGGQNCTFIGCHFDGPQNATEAASAETSVVFVQGDSCYFKNCAFGTYWQGMTAGRLLQIGHGAASVTGVFEDCQFIMSASGANPRFIRVQPDTGVGTVFFKGCQFINIGSTSLTYAIDGVGLGNSKLFFDSDCSFAGVTDIVSANMEGKVYFANGYFANAQSNGVAQNPDVS